MQRNNECGSSKDQASSGSNVLNALNSKYRCLSEPQTSASRPDNYNGCRNYLTHLWVFGSREADVELLPSSFSKLLEDENSIDPQRVKDKITHAISALSLRDPHVLVQFWSLTTVQKRCFLTTLDQPFGLGVVDEGLYLYRQESERRNFVVNGDHKEQLAPPGRVYRQKLPEWSLDVQTLPTIDLDVSYNIYGYIDLPVFEPDNGSCVGVLEIVSSSSYVDYAFEVQEVSRALKEHNLKSPMAFEDPRFYVQVRDERRQHELDEIYSMLKTVCDLQKLPLAQMWALSGYSSIVVNSGNLESSCSSFNKNCIGKVCMSTSDLPFYVRDLSTWGFREACRERHLDKSQGIVGKSLTSRGLCFCKDVTKLGKEEYPMASYARGYEITSCLAIYLISFESDIEYVIEFVLPPHNANEADLQSLVLTIKQQIKNVSSVKLGILSSPQVLGGDPLNWNFESPPSRITLLTQKEEFMPEPQQLSVENERNDVPFSKDESEVAYVEHMKDDNLEIELMDNAAAGTSQSIVPCLNAGIEDVDIKKGKTETKIHHNKSNTPKRKKKKTERSISVEEISKHYGKPMEEAAVNLHGILSSPITLLTEKEEFLPEPQQLSVENERNDVPFSKDKSEVAYVEHMKDDNLEIELMDNAAAGTSQIIVPCLNAGIEDVDINKGKTETKIHHDKSNTPKRKKKKTEMSISVKEISKHYGKPMEEAAGNLGVSRSTLKRICRSLDIPRWPYKNDKSNYVLKSNETDAVIRASQGTPIPVLGTSTEPSGTTNIPYLPVTLTEHGKQKSSIVVSHDEEQKIPPVGSAKPETTIREQHIVNTLATNTLMIKATYKEDIVKFPFMLSDGLVKLEELVATRFQLSPGSFSLKYEDADGDMILLTCDLDLIELVADSRQPDNQTVIRLLVSHTAHQP